MTGSLHQSILHLFDDDPWLAFDILGVPRPIEGDPTPHRSDVEAPADQPWTMIQGLPDRVLVYKHEGRPGIVISIEAQKQGDLEKRWRIPFYQAILAATHRLQTWCVVISFSRGFSAAMARWSTGPPPRVDALVLDVDSVPVMTLEAARARPTAAVLAAALHAYAGHFEPAWIALQVLRELSTELRRRYLPAIFSVLPPEARLALIGEIPVFENDELFEIEQASGTYIHALSVGEERGMQKGIERGRCMSLVEMIFTIFDLRGLAVDTASEARIRGSDTLSQLQSWARRALEVRTVPELFEAAEGLG